MSGVSCEGERLVTIVMPVGDRGLRDGSREHRTPITAHHAGHVSSIRLCCHGDRGRVTSHVINYVTLHTNVSHRSIYGYL